MHIQDWIDLCKIQMKEIADEYNDKNYERDCHFESELMTLEEKFNAIADTVFAMEYYRDKCFDTECDDSDIEAHAERVPAEEEALINQCINESLGTKEILLRFPVDMFDEMQKLSIEVGVSLPFFIRARLQEALFDHKSGLTVIT